MFKIDDAVKIRFSTLAGTVKGAAIDQTTLAVQYLVDYLDKEGQPQQRYFVADELEAA